MCTMIKKTTKKAGSLILKPFKWYVRTAAKNYELMYGENIKYVRFFV